MRNFKGFSMIYLYALLAFGAFISGAMLIIDPSGTTMGLAKDLLFNSPFQNYLIPGLLLFFVIGGSQALSAYALIKGKAYMKESLLFAGLSLLMWIVVQLFLLGYVFFLQAIILCVSIFELVYAFKFRN